MATTTTTNLSLTLAVPGSNEPFATPVVNANFEAIDAEVGSLRSTDTSNGVRLTNIEKITLPTVAAADYIGGVIPAGTAAERDGYWGIPGDATARLALARRVARWFNTETGFEEQYFALWADDTDKKFSAKAAGWYKNGARELPIPAYNSTAATSDIFDMAANMQLGNATGDSRVFMQGSTIYGAIRVNDAGGSFTHAEQLLTFKAGYGPPNSNIALSGLVSSGVTAQIVGVIVDGPSGGNPRVMKVLNPPGGSVLEVTFRFDTVWGA